MNPQSIENDGVIVLAPNHRYLRQMRGKNGASVSIRLQWKSVSLDGYFSICRLITKGFTAGFAWYRKVT